MAIGPSILEQEDALKNLPTQALQQMMRQPSPNAPPFLVAAELKRREEMEKEFAGRQAAAQTAQNAPTVAHRLAGMQQPMPMSQAGAMAAPPQQPPMPQGAQMAMALSGATGQPPPQLPMVNMATGTSGASIEELVKAMQSKGTRTSSQMPAHQPFASERRPAPVPNRGGLAALIAAIVKQQSEPDGAYGGFDISKEVPLPRGRSGMRAPARPVTAANGTQGRTVYAQTGFSQLPQAGTEGGTTRNIIQPISEGGRNTPMAMLARALMGPAPTLPPLTEAQALEAARLGVNPQVYAQGLKSDQANAEARAAGAEFFGGLGDRAGDFIRNLPLVHSGAELTAQNMPFVHSGNDELIAQNLQQGIASPDAMAQAGGPTVSAVSPAQEPPAVRRRSSLVRRGSGGFDPNSIAGRIIASRTRAAERDAQFASDVSGMSDVDRAAAIAKEEARSPGPALRSPGAAQRLAVLRAAGPPQPDGLPLNLLPTGDPRKMIPQPASAGAVPTAVATQDEAPLLVVPESVVANPETLKLATPSGEKAAQTAAAIGGQGADVLGGIVDVRDIYQKSLDQLSEGTREAYKDMDAKLKEVSKLNKADFDKLGESFKALEDYHKTGKLPEDRRYRSLTSLLLEMSKGFLGNPTMYEGFKAGIEGFQAVDAKDRKEYADGLSAMLTANQALLNAKVTMRSGELKERQALIRGRRAENLGNVQLATEQMKVASQENERVRTAQYRMENLEVLRKNANANMLNATTTTLQKDIGALADSDLRRIRAAIQRGKTDPAYRATDEYQSAVGELGTNFIVDTDGTAHPNAGIYGKKVQDMTKVPSAYQVEATQSRFDSQKVAFITRIDRALAPLLEGRANTDKEVWKAIAASAKIPLPKDGKIGSQWFTDNNAALREAARLYIGRQMAGQVGYAGKMGQWLKDRGYLGQQGGAVQGMPTRSLEEITTTPKPK